MNHLVDALDNPESYLNVYNKFINMSILPAHQTIMMGSMPHLTPKEALQALEQVPLTISPGRSCRDGHLRRP
jgi:hypothetical protein